MANLRNVVYLTQVQYDTLLNDGEITVGDITITYDENDLYLVPENRALYRHNISFNWSATINGSSLTLPVKGYVITNSATQLVAKDLYTNANKLVMISMSQQGPVGGITNVYTSQTGPSTYGLYFSVITTGGYSSNLVINNDGSSDNTASFTDTVEQLL